MCSSFPNGFVARGEKVIWVRAREEGILQSNLDRVICFRNIPKSFNQVWMQGSETHTEKKKIEQYMTRNVNGLGNDRAERYFYFFLYNISVLL